MCPFPLNVYRWALGASVYLGKEVAYVKCPAPISPTCLPMGAGANKHLGKKIPYCPMPIFPKCMQMGTGVNGHLGQMHIWGKRYPKCLKGVPQLPCVHFPKMYANGHWGKFEKRAPQVSCAHFPQIFSNGPLRPKCPFA